MNEFAYLADDEIGKLATISILELDDNTKTNEDDAMTAKEKFKQEQRSNRISKNDFGFRLGQLMKGERASNYDNSHIWNLRDQISKEVAPEIRRRQLAWANTNPV